MSANPVDHKRQEALMRMQLDARPHRHCGGVTTLLVKLPLPYSAPYSTVYSPRSLPLLVHLPMPEMTKSPTLPWIRLLFPRPKSRKGCTMDDKKLGRRGCFSPASFSEAARRHVLYRLRKGLRGGDRTEGRNQGPDEPCTGTLGPVGYKPTPIRGAMIF